MPRLVVLDAMGLAYRAYYAFIRRPLVNSKGENTSALYGFATMTLKIRRELRPDRWALAWDGRGPTFRHERFPDYKATRKPMPADLLAQIPAIEDFAQAVGLPVLEIPGVEADDVMATLAARASAEGWEVTLVTSDKDMTQLVNDRVQIVSPTGKGEEYARVDREAVRAKWGVAPEQMVDVLALMGDTSDNIPGVPGIGSKTAVELITAFGSLDALYARLAEVPREGLRTKLETHRALAMLSRDLVTLRTDLALPVGLDQLEVGALRRDDLAALAKRYEVQRLHQLARDFGVDEEQAGERAHARDRSLRGTAAEARAEGVKLAPDGPSVKVARESPGLDLSTEVPVAAGPVAAPSAEAVPQPVFAPATPSPSVAAAPREARALPRAASAPQETLDLFGEAGSGGAPGAALDEWIAQLHEVRARAIHGLALLPVLGEGGARRAPLVGLAIAAFDGTASYVPLAHAAGPNLAWDALRGWLAPALADPLVPKLAADLKTLVHALARHGLAFEGLDLDLGVASFVCDPARDHSLDALARDVLGEELPPLDPAMQRGKTRPERSSRAVDATAADAIRRVRAIPPIAEALRGQMTSRAQWDLYERIERPLIPVLADMERAGVRLDRAVLDELAARAGEDIARLEAELLALAGEPINLQSGPQLARLMFETFGLEAGRRTKTGFSTDQATLEELADAHPFPKKLLEYRALAKLKSTYLDALPLEVDPADGRIHTTFHQAGAATGRLSSSGPNLQNIPIRTPQGRAIRRAFVARVGGLLIGADYSQIELRVMAHLSGDPQLIEAFTSGEDIHAATARRVFGVTGELDPGLRARAKVVNFGVMYGMGARSLSQQMGISPTEAQEFIAHYFRVYARVREYLDDTVTEARRRGYVETLLGRRRWLPGLESANGGERALAERVAINTPIQGTAADLMKLAMIRVHGTLARAHPSARLLLQVHDELVVEADAADAEAVADAVRRDMEGCLPLAVPLAVTASHGPTWFDVH